MKCWELLKTSNPYLFALSLRTLLKLVCSDLKIVSFRAFAPDPLTGRVESVPHLGGLGIGTIFTIRLNLKERGTDKEKTPEPLQPQFVHLKGPPFAFGAGPPETLIRP